MKTKQDIVLNFINQFSNNRPQVVECFTQDMCFWFARILRERFWPGEPNVNIMYDSVANHFGCQIDDDVYDITGIVTTKYNWQGWNTYKFQNIAETKQLVRDCIFKAPQSAVICALCDEAFDDDYGNLICGRDNKPHCANDICIFQEDNNEMDRIQ